MQTVYAVCTAMISVGIVIYDQLCCLRDRFYYYRKRLETATKPLLIKFPPWITPDRLSWSRVPLGMSVVFFLFFYPVRIIAILLYTLAWITDILDGALARCWEKFSAWGYKIDPIADKIMNDSIFVGYAYSGRSDLFELQMTLKIIVAADLATAIAAGLMSYFVNKRVESNIWGKLKFGFQCAGCMLLIFNWICLAKPVLEIAALLGIMSFLSYFYEGYRQLRS